MVRDTDTEVQHITLIDSLNGEWLKVPSAVMKDCGPAVQTMAGILRITDKETFVATAEIAGRARLPVNTARKHLATLEECGWIARQGRQKTRGGRLRRTATVKVTKPTRDLIEPYGILPWWACCRIRNLHGHRRPGALPWSAKAVLSVVMARLCRLKKAVDEQDGHGADSEDIPGSIDNLGGDDRFRFSLNVLARDTGLHRESVVKAKTMLNRAGIVAWQADQDDHGGDLTDIVCPNWDFRVIITEAPRGGVWLDFERGSDFGQ